MGDVGDIVAGQAGHGSDDSPNDDEPGWHAIVSVMNAEWGRR
jgi:hypothetical protein